MKPLRNILLRLPIVACFVPLAIACVDTGTSSTRTDNTTGGSGSTRTEVTGEAAAMVKSMGMGVNIGNTLENTTTWETGWGQPKITQAYVNGLAAHGIKTVRVPVAWDTFATGGVIPADHLTRVQEVVTWIVDAGMYAIVDIHWDKGWIRSQGTPDEGTLTDSVRTKFESYWTQIASGYTEQGDHLIFEALNEEGTFYVSGGTSGTADYKPLNELNQLFVDTVRKSGGENATRKLLIAGFGTDISRTCVDAFAIPKDEAGEGKLFLSLHYYDPSDFTILGAPANYYGEVWTYPRTTWGTEAEQSALTSQFNRLAAFSRQRNIPVIIGEFAVTFGRGDYVRESASRILWMKSVATAAFAGGMVPVLWDTGGDVNRADGSLNPDFQTMMTELGL